MLLVDLIKSYRQEGQPEVSRVHTANLDDHNQVDRIKIIGSRSLDVRAPTYQLVV